MAGTYLIEFTDDEPLSVDVDGADDVTMEQGWVVVQAQGKVTAFPGIRVRRMTYTPKSAAPAGGSA